MRSDVGEGMSPGHRLSYTTEEAAAATGIKQRTIELYCKRGKLKAKKIGKNWIIPAASLLALVSVDEPEGAVANG